MMDDWDSYQYARQKAEGKLAFYAHLTIYVVISGFLLFQNLSNAPQYPWVHWPIIGWGIGVLFHSIVIYVFRGESFLTERMIERELKLGRAERERLHDG